jgi:hypothetical protein
MNNHRANGNGHQSVTDLKELVVEQPEAAEGAGQTISLTAAQAGKQLGKDARTVRRYITDGIQTANGETLRLKGRQVTTSRGPEWQIYQNDLDDFKALRDRSATEGQPGGQLVRSAEESQALAALTSTIQLISAELEQRSLALAEAQTTIERLSAEAGRQAGLNEASERERATLLQRIQQLEGERNEWQQKAWELQSKMPKKVRLFGWGSGQE